MAAVHSFINGWVCWTRDYKKRIARQQVITKWMLCTKFLIRAGSGVCIAVTASDPFNPAVHSIFLTHHGVNDCAREMDHIVCGLPSESKRQIRVIGSSYNSRIPTKQSRIVFSFDLEWQKLFVSITLLRRRKIQSPVLSKNETRNWKVLRLINLTS